MIEYLRHHPEGLGWAEVSDFLGNPARATVQEDLDAMTRSRKRAGERLPPPVGPTVGYEPKTVRFPAVIG